MLESNYDTSYNPLELEIIGLLINKLDEHINDINIINRFSDSPTHTLSRLDQTRRSNSVSRILKYYRMVDADCYKRVYLTDIKLNNDQYTKIGITYSVENRFASDYESVWFKFSHGNVVESEIMHTVRASIIEAVVLDLWKSRGLLREASAFFDGKNECATFEKETRDLALTAIELCTTLMTCKDTGLSLPLHEPTGFFATVLDTAERGGTIKWQKK